VALGQPQPSARVFFPYPKYCLKDENGVITEGKDVTEGGEGATGGVTTSSALKQGASFLKTSNWASKPLLRAF